ncbi:hypothetical protein UFOVP231_1 [uncultured Caudovirales phage]|uniref:Uncharacterized protein n=1 Tax=uncultured Caudovirales phage TaxID=2100421 RepID=A0A6J7WQ94_9CAUD|nr:hypothetical protein UFOVP231_1 [uncultured Caudovirales phage]
MKVVAQEDVWVVLTSNGDQIAGPFPTQAEAWRWVDRNHWEDCEMESTRVRVREAFSTR